MTATTVASFFESLHEEKSKLLAEMISQSHEVKNSDKKTFKRSPASEKQKTVIQQETSDLKLPNQQQKVPIVIFCDAKSLHLDSSSQLLMLEITACLNLKEKNQLWIKNETNGFKAQIFTLGAKKFKTDFIQLNPGLNKLSLLGVLKDGQKVEQTLEILSGS